MGEPQPRVIKASVGKAWLYLLGSAALTAGGVLMAQDPEEPVWKGLFCAIFFGACSVVSLIAIVRPHRLHLDAEGFRLEGGMGRKPRRWAWKDIQEFFVYRLPRGGKMIGFNYVDDHPSALNSIWNRGSAAHGGLPSGWPGKPEALVEQLNAYRLSAVTIASMREP